MPKRNEFAERLSLVLRDKSQAEIARRTKTSAPNVSRYLSGTRVPADFCGDLVREFSVSAHWLLTGQGAPFQTELAPSGEQLAGSLLELVGAMNAVAKMRLGALTGQRAGKVLRELSDALLRYEKVKETLLDHSQRVLGELIKTLGAALRKRDLVQARGLLQSADQVAKFCEDRQMLWILDSLRGELAFRSGRRDEALRVQGEVVQRVLMSGIGHGEHAFLQVNNYVIALTDRQRLHEARRSAKAALALGEETGPKWRGIALLRCAAGRLDIELGELARGLATLHQGIAQLPDVDPSVGHEEPLRQRASLCRAELLSGVLSLPHFLAMRELRPHSLPFCARHALWLEDAALLEQVKEAQPAGEDADNHNALAYAALGHLHAALKGRGRRAPEAARKELGELLARDRAPFHEFAAEVLLAQVAHAAGDARASEHREKAKALLDAMPEGVTPPLEIRALHFRNWLRAGDQAGRGFFDQHCAAGYRAWRVSTGA